MYNAQVPCVTEKTNDADGAVRQREIRAGTNSDNWPNFKRNHAKPRPLGQNGHESWYGTGASVGYFYVVKHVELVLPRYVVEFDVPVPPLFNPFNFAPAIDPLAFAPPLPQIPPHRFGVGRVSAIKRGAAENQDVKGGTGKGKSELKTQGRLRMIFLVSE
ncbi:hypothetical protein B0H13DRAFT_1859639 [Mycena leptocephala]|nr:hypothetical protein B0H13DRAFT_1859639 [Mycena leptocephala]